MPTVTLKIAPQGTSLGEELTSHLSLAGHVWFSINDGNGNIDSYGFNSQSVSKDDDNLYQKDNFLGRIYEKTINITEAEYNELKRYGEYYAGLSSDKPNVEFNADYSVIKNSCVDFTWKALESAGLNPIGFEGDLLPISNIDNFNRLGDMLNNGLRGNNLKGYEQNSVVYSMLDIYRYIEFLEGLTLTYSFNGWMDLFNLIKQSPELLNNNLDNLNDVINNLLPMLNIPGINSLDDISTLLDDFPPILELLGISTNEDFRSPLVLDLNNDRITSLNLDESSVYFDLDNNNFKEQTAWISKFTYLNSNKANQFKYVNLNKTSNLQLNLIKFVA